MKCGYPLAGYCYFVCVPFLDREKRKSRTFANIFRHNKKSKSFCELVLNLYSFYISECNLYLNCTINLERFANRRSMVNCCMYKTIQLHLIHEKRNLR